MTSAFAPRLLAAHAAMLVSVSAATGLGVWQYDAYQARKQAERIDLTQETPRPLTDLMGSDDPFPGADVGRPVDVRGTWVPTGTVFVSGREHDGVDGFWVVTPVAVGGEGRPAVPVVRGWVPTVADAPPAPSGEVDLVGSLQPTEGTGETDPNPDDDVIPQVRIADLIQHVDQDLYSAYVVDDTPSAGLVKADLAALPDSGRFTGLRNFLYAIEWWLFGLFALYIWGRFVRDETREPDDLGDGTATPSGPAPDDHPVPSNA
ncbi:SURF1 family protein [Nocardioides sp. TRM66260-LWL]|uniref:SURF1 family protein n=1 Tax=Nocardioides sp. TRM66260-LWL TaxID=2874478 RepID=UPI001CC5CC83|nr:SURF1 family protein [Nocardioides sp. TRM66260-LWL]MBZ5735542.1 SURF1 family protein [Nocardioides sp. TRM66260-LWL]